MRFALISLEEPANGADGSLRVAGRAIYRWQAEMALACGCERVLCWAPQEIAAPLALQKEVEGRGSRFQPVGDLHRLARIVGPGDELLVFSPGLMIEEDRLAGFVEDGHGIATIPAREGGEDGFDRIDLTRLAAGLMFLPGNLVARLADLPEDCEPGGSLLRIALQSGIPTRAVPESGEEANAYTIVRSEVDAKAIETGWFERDWKRTSGPRNRLSRFVTDLIGKRAAHDERGPGLALGAVALGTLTTCALAIGGYAGGSLAGGCARCRERARGSRDGASLLGRDCSSTSCSRGSSSWRSTGGVRRRSTVCSSGWRWCCRCGSPIAIGGRHWSTVRWLPPFSVYRLFSAPCCPSPRS